MHRNQSWVVLAVAEGTGNVIIGQVEFFMRVGDTHVPEPGVQLFFC